MNRFQREALDRHITGNYGEDQFRGEDEDMTRNEALKKLMGLIDNLDDLISVSTMTDFEGVLAALSSPCACGEPLEMLESLARDTADKYGGFASIDLPVDQVVADYFAVAWSPETGYDYQTGIGGGAEEDKEHLTREEAIALLLKMLPTDEPQEGEA